MQTDLQTNTEVEPIASPHAPQSGWIGWSLIAGLIVAIPAGWLLAFLAALPFLLGLFFFTLIGLIVGAVMFRVGSKAPIASTQTLWLFGLAVTVTLMGASLWTEYRALPRSVEKRVRDSIHEPLTPERRAELSGGVREFVAKELHTNYAPGGFLGYLRWAATTGTFTCPRILKPSTVEYRLPHQRKLWLTRVGLSSGLAGWAILSQLLGLRAAARQKRAEDDADSEPPTGRQDTP